MKKSFKKVLSAVLAVLMVVSSVPVASIVASAATTDIVAAMEAYEAKMNGTKIYTNMAAAYNAYVDANEAYDAYVFGYNTGVDLATATANLTSATNAMTEWTAYTGTARTSFSGDTTGTTFDGYVNNGVNYQANLLYAPQCTNYINTTTTGNVVVDFHISNEITMLYDGVTNPRIPVLIRYKVNANKTRYFHSGYVTSDMTSTGDIDAATGNPPNSTNLRMMGYWAAVAGDGDRTANWTWTMANKTNDVNYGPITAANSYKIQMKTSWIGSGRKVGVAANSLDYVGTPTSALTEINERFFVWTGDDVSDEHYHAMPTVRVINYKMLTDALKNNLSKIDCSTSSYDEGGLATILAAYDAATAINPNTYFASGNDYTGCANAIQNATNAINNAVVTVDGNGYQTLRNAIELAAPTYFAMVDDHSAYTDESWAVFEQECNEAVAVMQAVTSNSYNDNAGAQKAGDELRAAYEGLKTNDVKVDASALVTSISNAVDAIKFKNYFTTDSYAAANLEEVVKNAKIAVWGVEENYLVEASLPTDNDEGRALVAQQVDLVNAAIAKLIFNCDHGLAAYDNMSINSGIAKAATYNPADYANFATVNEAVANANLFKNNNGVEGCLNGATEGIVATKVHYYDAIVNQINNAFNNLQPAFSKIANGTVANAGSATTTSVTSPNEGRWRLDAVYNNGGIYFRTNKEAASFNLGGMALNWVTDRDFDQLLDSININDVSNPSYHDSGKGELNAIGGTIVGGDPTGYGLTQEYRDMVPGGLTLSNAGGTFALSNIKALSTSTGAYGKDASGNDITSTSTDFTSLLATTNATDTFTGGALAKNGTTKLIADYTLSMAAKSAVTLSASTVPTSTTFAPTGVYFGMVYGYLYVPTAIQKYAGYGHAKTSWAPIATVIDVSNLFELIEICDALDSTVYTADSWANLTSALGAAKDDMAYGTMSADAILSECQTRYTNLWNAYAALEEAYATVTFVNAAGTTLSAIKYEIGTPAANINVPANTATTYTDSNHTIYSWPTIADVSVNVTYTEVAKTNTHAYEVTDRLDATCAEDGYKVFTCTVCSQSYTQTIAATGSHSYEETERVEATCIADGHVTYTCSVCGDSYTDVIAASGTHTWELTTTIVAPTCTSQGEGEYTCSVCNETKTDIIDFAPHTYVNATASLDKYNATGEFSVDDYYFVMIQESTCDTEGEAELWCDNADCEADPVIQVLPFNSNNHTWSTRPSATVNATCQTEGYKEYKCTGCDATKRDVIPTTDHSKGSPVQENVVAATCTTDGSYDTVIYCTVCNAEVSRVNTVVPATGHTEGAPVQENVVAETGAANGSYDSVVYCTVCGAEISRNTVVVDELDASAYEAALATVETTKSESTYEAKYTADSRAAFEAAVANAKIDLAATTTQDAIDNAATALTTALTLLKEAPQGYTVTFDVITDDEATATTSTDGYIYGETITLDAASYVTNGAIYKWTVEDDITGGTTKIASNDAVLDIVVTSDLTVTVYIATVPEDTTDYKKISLYGPTGAVIGIGYVPADEAFTYDASSAEIEINGMTFTAPSRAFYTFNGWIVKAETETELKLKPTYTFVEGESEANVCYIVGVGDIKVNGVENYKADYDESVSLTGAGNYAIATLVDGKYVISTYLVTSRLHAPHEQTVYIIAVDPADIVATSTITGTYTESRAQGKVTVGFNNAFFLPEGAELIECGTIATARDTVANDDDAFVMGGAGVNKLTSEIQTKLNEYTIEFTLPTGIATTLYGRAYLVYRVGGEEITIYSDVVSVAL